jgi:type IV fimbrial biogenesis protein FimT
MKKRSGFTMIELLITIAIAGILLGLAIPSFQDFSRRNFINAQVNRLIADVNLARTTALTRQRIASICASTDGAGCTGGSALGVGWITYTATAPVTAYVASVNPPTEIMKAGEALPSNNYAMTIQTGLQYISFGPDARLAGLAGGGPGQIVVNVCYGGTSTTRVPGVSVTISGSGRPASRRMPVGPC